MPARRGQDVLGGEQLSGGLVDDERGAGRQPAQVVLEAEGSTDPAPAVGHAPVVLHPGHGGQDTQDGRAQRPVQDPLPMQIADGHEDLSRSVLHGVGVLELAGEQDGIGRQRRPLPPAQRLIRRQRLVVAVPVAAWRAVAAPRRLVLRRGERRRPVRGDPPSRAVSADPDLEHLRKHGGGHHVAVHPGAQIPAFIGEVVIRSAARKRRPLGSRSDGGQPAGGALGSRSTEDQRGGRGLVGDGRAQAHSRDVDRRDDTAHQEGGRDRRHQQQASGGARTTPRRRAGRSGRGLPAQRDRRRERRRVERSEQGANLADGAVRHDLSSTARGVMGCPPGSGAPSARRRRARARCRRTAKVAREQPSAAAA